MGLSEDGMLAVIPVPHPVRALCSINCSIVLVKWHKHPNLQGFFFSCIQLGRVVCLLVCLSHTSGNPLITVLLLLSQILQEFTCTLAWHRLYSLLRLFAIGSSSLLLVLFPNITNKKFLLLLKQSIHIL